jgi:hypothetical protein
MGVRGRKGQTGAGERGVEETCCRMCWRQEIARMCWIGIRSPQDCSLKCLLLLVSVLFGMRYNAMLQYDSFACNLGLCACTMEGLESISPECREYSLTSVRAHTHDHTQPSAYIGVKSPATNCYPRFSPLTAHPRGSTHFLPRCWAREGAVVLGLVVVSAVRAAAVPKKQVARERVPAMEERRSGARWSGVRGKQARQCFQISSLRLRKSCGSSL